MSLSVADIYENYLESKVSYRRREREEASFKTQKFTRSTKLAI